MNTLALDLGLLLGWCLTDGHVYDGGVWDLKSNRFEGGGMRYLRFRRQLRAMLKHDVGQVVYEEVRGHRGVDAAHVYGGLQAVLTEECELQEIPYESVPVGTLKKFATGKGNSNKEAMIEAAQRLWPHIEIVDDNQADAMLLARYVVERLNGEALT